MSLRLRKPGEITAVDETTSCSSPVVRLAHRRRLRLACTAIYFTKVLESLTKKALGNNLGILRSLSYVAIDVPPGDDCSKDGKDEKVDPKSLSPMIRGKTLEALAKFGGMKVTEFWVGKEQVKNNDVAPTVLELFLAGIGLNTTGTVYRPEGTASVPEVSGSPTEKAILSWGVIELGLKMDELKRGCQIIQVEAFNSEKKKRSGILMRRGACIYVHWKGAAEMILAQCSQFYSQDGDKQMLDAQARGQIRATIEKMAANSLRCIAFAHREVTDPQPHESYLEDSELTLLGVVGLKDPCRPDVRSAVESCKNAGVNTKMITGDNVHTARAIAIECGILETPKDNSNIDEMIVEGVEFRNFSPEQRFGAVDKIRVMARSSPFDKLLMHGLNEGWHEGGSTIIASFLVVVVSAVSNYKQSRQFQKLSNLSSDIMVEVFNEFNARKLEEKNVFNGLHKNKLFIGIIGITLVLQVLMIEFLNKVDCEYKIAAKRKRKQRPWLEAGERPEAR
ncbi:hypothetical protein CRG98_034750 [Punica granatum]|uniref:Cation-transporting P-type ATPase C-terminal domain-containing protein n=1 Tax=Punica granatum TaxID=22663 RepID=A0A2I0ILC4_PUNGR|nr:hypothetical protein CRG98_034750 [Punica granatum]